MKPKISDSRSINLNVGLMYLKLGKPEVALEILTDALPGVEQRNSKDFSFLIYNAIAWTNLVLENLDKAHKHAKQAMELQPTNQYALGTLGCILVEKGEHLNGRVMMQEFVDFRFANNETLVKAMYVACSYHFTGNMESAEKHIQFVLANEGKLDWDEKVLFERVKEKMKHQHS